MRTRKKGGAAVGVSVEAILRIYRPIDVEVGEVNPKEKHKRKGVIERKKGEGG